MTRTQRLLVVIVAGALAAGTAALVGDGGTTVDLVLLSAALVATELLELRPVDRAPLSSVFRRCGRARTCRDADAVFDHRGVRLSDRSCSA